MVHWGNFKYFEKKNYKKFHLHVKVFLRKKTCSNFPKVIFFDPNDILETLQY